MVCVHVGIAALHTRHDVVSKPMHAAVCQRRVVVVVEPQPVVVHERHVVVDLDRVDARHRRQHVVNAHHLHRLRPDDELGALWELVDLRLTLGLSQRHQMSVHGRPRHLQ